MDLSAECCVVGLLEDAASWEFWRMRNGPNWRTLRGISGGLFFVGLLADFSSWDFWRMRDN